MRPVFRYLAILSLLQAFAHVAHPQQQREENRPSFSAPAVLWSNPPPVLVTPTLMAAACEGA